MNIYEFSPQATPPAPSKSKAWDYFTIHEDHFKCGVKDDNENTCTATISRRKNVSAGGLAFNLKRHLKRYHHETFTIVEKADGERLEKIRKETPTSTTSTSRQLTLNT